MSVEVGIKINSIVKALETADSAECEYDFG